MQINTIKNYRSLHIIWEKKIVRMLDEIRITKKCIIRMLEQKSEIIDAKAESIFKIVVILNTIGNSK